MKKATAAAVAVSKEATLRSCRNLLCIDLSGSQPAMSRTSSNKRRGASRMDQGTDGYSGHKASVQPKWVREKYFIHTTKVSYTLLLFAT